MNRRIFLFSLISCPQRSGIQVEVIETFRSSDGPSAFMVHHARESERPEFGQWLKKNTGRVVTCRLPDGTAIDARIFRINLCFGRGLILTRSATAVEAKDLTLLY